MKPKITEVVNSLSNYYGISLKKVKGKKIFYEAYDKNNDRILVCSPESKLHKNGHGWTDLTEIQVDLMKKADKAIVAFRIEGEKIFYVDFKVLKDFLTEECKTNNDREDNHWKIYLWDNYIQVRANKNTLNQFITI